jgi:hypothetical protein
MAVTSKLVKALNTSISAFFANYDIEVKDESENDA